MALQANGTISLTEVATEFGGTAPHQMSEYFGVDIGVPASGSAIGLTNFYGKANKFVATITASVQQLNLRTWLISQGWDQNRRPEVTINSGVYIWSDNTSVAALDMGGSYPKGLTIINNGFIIGRGGNGADAAAVYSATTGVTIPVANGGAGGNAINLTGPVTIDNTNGYIGGGGGGGGCGYYTSYFAQASGGAGGGAGGGLGGKAFATASNVVYLSLNGPGGAIGQVGTVSFVNPSNLATTYVIYPTHGGAGGYTGAAGQNKFNPI